MKHYIKILILFICLFKAGTVLAQSQLIYDFKGEPLKKATYSELDGSPFLMNSWAKGSVKFSNNKIIDNVDLKYDEVRDALLFRGKNDEELYFIDPIKEFRITDPVNQIQRVFKNGFSPLKYLTVQSFYEVVTEGNISFLKKNVKTIIENKEFNSAVTIKKVSTSSYFYFTFNNKVFSIQKKEDIYNFINEVTPQKANLIIAFISDNKLNTKRKQDLIKIVSQINSQ